MKVTTTALLLLCALLLVSLILPAFSQAGSLDVNSNGRMVFEGGGGGSKITYNHRSGVDYPYRVSDETTPVRVPSGSKKCKEVDDMAVCKGVTEGPLFRLGEGKDSFASRAESGLSITVSGGDDTDYILGGKGNDTLNGNGGEDIILAGQGKNVISGGGGVDFITTTAAGVDKVTCTERDLLFVSKGDIHIGCRPVNSGPSFDTTCRGQDWIYYSGSNEVTLSSVTDMAVGGSGADTFYGMLGDDCLWGRGGDDKLYGEEGNDILLSGAGYDFLKGGRGADLMIGDTTESPKSRAVFSAHDGKRDKVICFSGDVVVADSKDRVIGCRDYVADPSACRAYRAGGVGPDIFNPRRDTLALLGSGDDVFEGSAEGDCAFGENGSDKLFGGGSRDILISGAGDDKVLGGPGPDLIFGGPGEDSLFGNRGRDRIQSVDGQRDIVKCGPGRDRVVADFTDKVRRDCEQVKRKRA